MLDIMYNHACVCPDNAEWTHTHTHTHTHWGV